MKEKLLHFGSYVLVAVLTTVLTLTMVHLEVGLKPSKLDQLEDLIQERFIGVRTLRSWKMLRQTLW